MQPGGQPVFDEFFREKMGPLTLRLALGLEFVSHGYLKIMAGGGTTWQPGLGTAWQLFIAWGQFAAGLAILLGFNCRRSVAIGLAVQIGLLAWTYGWGYFQLPIRTLEPIIFLQLVCLTLLFTGPGHLSLDAKLAGNSAAGRAPRKKLAA